MLNLFGLWSAESSEQVEEEEVKHYYASEDELPQGIRVEISSRLAAEEELIAALRTDINLEGYYNEQWALLTTSRLLLLGGAEEGLAVKQESDLIQVESIEIVHYHGNELLKIKSPSEGQEFLRCSKSVSEELNTFAKRLDDYLQDNFSNDESFIKDSLGERRGQANVKRCSKCGRPVSRRNNVCQNCLDKRRLLLRLLGYVRPHLPVALAGIFLLAISTFIGRLPPLISRSLIDDVLIPATGGDADVYAEGGALLTRFFTYFAPRGTIQLLSMIIIFMLVINVMRSLLDTARRYIVEWMGHRIVVEMRSQVYNHLQQLSLSFFNKQSTGRLIARVTSDVDRLRQFVSSELQRVAQDIFILIMIIAILFTMSWQLTLLIMLPAPLLVALTFFFRNKLRKVYRVLWRRNAALKGVVSDTIPGIQVVKAFSQERREGKKFDSKNVDLFFGYLRSLKLRTAYSPTMQFLTYTGTILIWWFGGQQVMEGTLTLGTLMAFTGYMWQFYRPVQDLCRMNHRFQRTATSADRVFEIMDAEPDVADIPDSVELPEIEGEVEFRDVTFSYDKGDPALHGISFHVEPGEVIGLAGHSGAGKSTLINLICRFYDPDEGEVLIDGYNLRDIKIESMRRQIGVVLQDPFLFTGTIAENISYGNPDASRIEVIAAAKAANAHDFIRSFPDGYETHVGERGVRISSGERQRISIARALLKDPKLLILDEATASVDTETEAQIQEALERLVEGRTTFAIAHRLSTLRNADRLFILDEGKIAEIGTHDELLAKEDGIYRRLYEMQRQMQAV